jgi:hypothetical protein
LSAEPASAIQDRAQDRALDGAAVVGRAGADRHPDAEPGSDRGVDDSNRLIQPRQEERGDDLDDAGDEAQSRRRLARQLTVGGRS